MRKKTTKHCHEFECPKCKERFHEFGARYKEKTEKGIIWQCTDCYLAS